MALLTISNEDELLANFQVQLEAFNSHTYNPQEFEHILNHLGKGNTSSKSSNPRDRFAVKRDTETLYVR